MHATGSDQKTVRFESDRSFGGIWGIILNLMGARGWLGIGVGRGRRIFGGKMGWMLGDGCCRKVWLASLLGDGGKWEMVTWKMTGVGGSTYSKVCLGDFI